MRKKCKRCGVPFMRDHTVCFSDECCRRRREEWEAEVVSCCGRARGECDCEFTQVVSCCGKAREECECEFEEMQE